MDIGIWAIIGIMAILFGYQYLDRQRYNNMLIVEIAKAMADLIADTETVPILGRSTVVMTLRDQQYPNLFRLINLLPEIRSAEQIDAIMSLFPMVAMTDQMSEEQLRQILPVSVECVISSHHSLGEANDDRYVTLESVYGKLVFRNSGGVLALRLDVIVCAETVEQLEALFNNLGLPVELVEVGKSD